MPADETRPSVDRFAKFDERDAALIRWRHDRGYVAEINRARYAKVFHGGRRMLDVGCGVGAAALFAGDATYVGIDLSETLVREGRARQGLAVAVADAAHLPFADGTFDRVVCLGVLHHMAALEVHGAIREMARVLEPDGELAVIEPNPWGPFQRLMAYVRPPERGILHTGPADLRRAIARVSELEIDLFEREHAMAVPAYLTFVLRRWRWVTGPRMTRWLMRLHALVVRLTPRALRSHTFWRLRKRGTGGGEGAGARPAAGPAA